jgi:hypothetical protein
VVTLRGIDFFGLSMDYLEEVRDFIIHELIRKQFLRSISVSPAELAVAMGEAMERLDSVESAHNVVGCQASIVLQ